MSKTRLVIGIIAVILLFKWFSTSDGTLTGGGIVTITPDNFDAEILQSSQPVLAYFWAPW